MLSLRVLLYHRSVSTHQRDSKDEDDDNEVDSHQDVVQTTNSTVQVTHRVLNGELLAMYLPICALQQVLQVQ